MNRWRSLAVGAAGAALLSVTQASAQATPAAGDRDAGRLAVGLGFSTANSDYTLNRITGATAFATYRLSRHFDVEADARFLTIGTPNDFGERTYMAGPRYVYRKFRLELYAKALAGIGQAVAQEPYVVNAYIPSTSFAAAFGGGVEIRLPKKITVRAVDFEYQDWPNFASNYGGNGLRPTVFTFGVAYRIR